MYCIMYMWFRKSFSIATHDICFKASFLSIISRHLELPIEASQGMEDRLDLRFQRERGWKIHLHQIYLFYLFIYLFIYFSIFYIAAVTAHGVFTNI